MICQSLGGITGNNPQWNMQCLLGTEKGTLLWAHYKHPAGLLLMLAGAIPGPADGPGHCWVCSLQTKAGRLIGPELQNRRATEPQKHRTTETQSQSHRTTVTEPQKHRTTESQSQNQSNSHRITEPQSHRTPESWNHRTTKP